MLKFLLKHRALTALIGIALVLKLFSLYPARVEQVYTYGVYPYIARVMRLVTGWLPFSFGDLVYFAAGIWLIYFIWRHIRTIRTIGLRKAAVPILYQISYVMLVVYVLFNLLWGLNYDREGIAPQLNLQVQTYTLAEAIQLTQTLQARLNTCAAQVDTIKRSAFNTNSKLFQTAISVYDATAAQFPYLAYRNPSIKSSLYSGVGHYFGFTGYYNPFSGEAQIKSRIPVFIKPFVVTHEIAHQLGYARENEANFVAFLATHQSNDVNFRYSSYYNLYIYAVREVYSRDSIIAKGFRDKLHPQVLRDNEILKAYFIQTENRIEPLISRFYDQYLKWNNQKSGVQTYNQVVALLIAYAKKWGWTAI